MKEKKSSFIFFFGPDGSGKSTQANLLFKYLKSKNPVVRVWIRGRHSLAFLFIKFLMKLGYYKRVKVPSGVVYEIFDPNLLPKMRRLLIVIELISVLPLIFIRVYLPRMFGYIVVAERYTVDTIVYLGYWYNQQFLNKIWTKILLSLIPQDSVIIHFNAKTETLVKRLHYDTATLDFLFFQQKAYQKLAKLLDVTTINTSKSNIKETFKQVINIVNKDN
jgi:thymidylate kinase